MTATTYRLASWRPTPALLSPVLLSIATACEAPKESRAPAAPVRRIAAADTARLRADVEWLADDLRSGRRAGTAEARAAGKWLAVRLAEVGLEPAGEEGYLQAFEIELPPRDGGESDVVIFSGEGEGAKVHGEGDVSPLFCAERGRVEGPLVFCGYGIESAERGRDDFAGLDLQGAIAFLVRGTPKSTGEEAAAASDTAITAPREGFGPSASIFVKAMNAKRRGALGVILAPSSPDEPMLRFDAGHGARAGIPAVAISASAAETLFPGYASRLESPAEPRDDARRVAVFADVAVEEGTAFNVLGLLPGRSGDYAVIVGAHYDHLGRGGSGSLAPPAAAGEIHNGADDNASGAATLIEIARLLKEGEEPPCDVYFALWSGEEEGLLGSEHWAEHPTVPLGRVVANLNLDMVGRAGNGELQVLGAGTSPGFAGWMDDAGTASGLELVVSTSGGALGGSSDHQTFLKRGIPALHLFSGLHEDYHKPSDDADKFEADGAAKVAVLGEFLVRRMAEAGKVAFVEPKVDKERAEQVKGGFRAWFGSIPSYSFDGPGVRLDGTSSGSPAERAGFLKGDVLRKVGDVEIETIYDFTYALNHYKPGDVVLVRFLRDGEEQETRVTLSTREMQ